MGLISSIVQWLDIGAGVLHLAVAIVLLVILFTPRR